MPLVDPVQRHVDVAESRLGAFAGFSAEVADGRTLPVADGSFDAVLLLGPLYHLPDRRDRDRTWSEASRATVSRGLIIAAAISRFASLFAGLSEREIFKDEFRAIVTKDLVTGHHDNVTRNENYFTTAYFHHPGEFEDEAVAAELTILEILGVEGLSAVLPQLSQDWEIPERREIIIESARAIESEPSLLGLGPHILLIARKAESDI